MTRTLAAGLLASAQSLRARPTVTLDFKDKRLRWTLPVSNGINSDDPTDLEWHTDTANRCRVNAAGEVHSQRITTLATDAQWDAWTLQLAAGGASASGDCAIAAYTDLLWLLYYVAPDAGNFKVRALYSTDAGASYGGPTDVVTSIAVQPRIAASSSFLIIQSATVDAYLMTWGAPPTWGAALNLAGYTDTNHYGCAIAYNAAGPNYQVLLAYDGLIEHRKLIVGAWSASGAIIYPGGASDVPTGSQHANPAIAIGANSFVASWLEDYDDSPNAWNLTVTHVSLDAGLHWGQECVLSFNHGTDRRAGLCFAGSEHAFYCAIERQTASAIEYNASDANSNHSALPVLTYRRRTHSSGTSYLQVRTHEVAQAYQLDGIADPHPVHPLASLYLNRGWGGATEPLDPHYLISARRTEYKGAGVLELEALDTWGILERWSPHHVITWSGHTITWLCAEICARVGFLWDDDADAAWARTVTTFTIRPTETAATSMRALVRLAGGVTRTNEAGKLYGINLIAHTQSEPTIGDKSEILHAELGTTLWLATSIRHVGDGQADYIENASDAMELGMRFNASVFDRRMDTSAIVQEAASRDLLLANASGRSDIVTVPMRPDIELWDLVLLSASGIGPPKRLVTRITEVFDIQHARYTSELELSLNPL